MVTREHFLVSSKLIFLTWSSVNDDRSMGKKRRWGFDPRRYRSIDVEAATRDSPAVHQDSDHPRYMRRAIEAERSPEPTTPGVRNSWLVCPCKSCEKSSKPSLRLMSTIQKHLRQYLMGERHKVKIVIPVP